MDVFADMVIAIFERLPSRDSIPDDTPANGGGSGGGLASMLQVCDPQAVEACRSLLFSGDMHHDDRVSAGQAPDTLPPEYDKALGHSCSCIVLASLDRVAEPLR